MNLRLPSFRPAVHTGCAGLLTISAAIILGSCGGASYRPLAIGAAGEVVVVVDSALWNGTVGQTLREELGAYIETLPAPELMFDVEHERIKSQATFDRITAKKNVVFAAALDDTTAEARFVRSVFSKEVQESIAEGRGVFVEKEDVWRRDQRVAYLAAATGQELTQIIRESAPNIRASFNEAERRRMERDMFDKGRQFELEDTLLTHHGFRLKVQHDYLIASDTTNFVWLRRVLQDSWRSAFVYYEEFADPMTLTPEWVYRTRDSLAQVHLQGNVGGFVAIDYRRPLDSESVDFLDRYGFESRGLWHMIGPGDDGELQSYGMGGPFVTYSFYDQPTGRIYIIDGMVFAPGFKKREFLRQMEVIAYTFRTQTELEPVVALVEATAQTSRES